MFKAYIFLEFYCVHVFSTVVKSISEATQLEEKLASNVKRTMQVASEKEASRWLATLRNRICPLQGAFRDALCYDIAGDLPIYHLTTSVAYTSQSSMH